MFFVSKYLFHYRWGVWCLNCFQNGSLASSQDHTYSSCVRVIVPVSQSVHWRPATRQRGVRVGSVRTRCHFRRHRGDLANSRVELTDVKIYLEANHAANRGTGILQQKLPGRARSS